MSYEQSIQQLLWLVFIWLSKFKLCGILQVFKNIVLLVNREKTINYQLIICLQCLW